MGRSVGAFFYGVNLFPTLQSAMLVETLFFIFFALWLSKVLKTLNDRVNILTLSAQLQYQINESFITELSERESGGISCPAVTLVSFTTPGNGINSRPGNG